MSKTKSATTALPEGFELSTQMLDFAQKKGIADPHGEFDAFKDYHEQHGNRFASWDAAWRTWVRNSEKWRRQDRAAPDYPIRPIGFTAPRAQPAKVVEAIRDNQEAAREVESMTVEQRRAAVAKIQAMISGIKG